MKLSAFHDHSVTTQPFHHSAPILLLLRIRERRKKNRYRKRFWIRPILQRRKEQGEYFNLAREMQLADHESFFKYFRMSPTLFENLLAVVAPLILKSDEKREPVSPAETLSVTLRYLFTGDSHQNNCVQL